MATFDTLNLSKPLLQALDELGFTEPTPIQEEVFPAAMSGRDVIGIARTGTGKTLAYLLPCLRQWRFHRDRPIQFLVLVPTRELVTQVVEEARSLARCMSFTVAGVYGGVSMSSQMDIPRDGCDLLVATPGRLLDFLLKGTLRMRSLRTLVLDEVDEMLSQGLRHQVVQIMDLLPPKRQHLLFSATFDPEVEILARQFFRDPVILHGESGPPEQIGMQAIRVPNFFTKASLLVHLMNARPDMTRVLVFTESRRMADRLADRLSLLTDQMPAVLHANKAQQQRFQALEKFDAGDTRLLIATDLAARGLDFQDVSHVIHFHLPDTPEAFIHRTGRTGRSGRSGQSILFLSEGERPYLQAIEEFLGHVIPVQNLLVEVIPIEDLLPEERPVIAMKSAPVRRVDEEGGGAFHQKKAKNTKVNNPNRWKEKLRAKYKKPKTRGPKKK